MTRRQTGLNRGARSSPPPGAPRGNPELVPIDSCASPWRSARSRRAAKYRRLSCGRRASGGIVIRPTTPTGQRSMKPASSAGAIPLLPASPATLTSIITWVLSVPWRASWASAESEATEWMYRTRSTTSRTLRLCSWPMKSQVNASPMASDLTARSWARFSPTSVTPASARTASSSTGTYLTAASTSMSAGSRPAASIWSRTRSRLARTVSARRPWIRSTTPRPPVVRSRRRHADASTAAPAARTACTGRCRDTALTPAASSWRRAISLRSRLSAAADARVLGERRVDLVSDLVAARAGARPDRGRQFGRLGPHRAPGRL